jgi:hypothetical protein
LSQAARKEKEREELAPDGRMHPQWVAQLEQEVGSAPVCDAGAGRSTLPAQITAREHSRIQAAVHWANGGPLGEYNAWQRELVEEE